MFRILSYYSCCFCIYCVHRKSGLHLPKCISRAHSVWCCIPQCNILFLSISIVLELEATSTVIFCISFLIHCLTRMPSIKTFLHKIGLKKEKTIYFRDVNSNPLAKLNMQHNDVMWNAYNYILLCILLKIVGFIGF